MTGADQRASAGKTTSDRTSLLLVMYGEMWDNVNRHVTVMWQGMVVLFTVVGAAYLRKTDTIGPDAATALVVLMATWVLAHSFDAAAWCNRNLLIIANIEREFLLPTDATRVQPYFAKPARRGMLEHLQIHSALACLVGIGALAEHFYTRILPGIGLSCSHLDPPRALPYIVAFVGMILLRRLHGHFRLQYDKLVEVTRPDHSATAALGEPAGQASRT